LSLDNVSFRSFVRVSFVFFMYRASVSCIVRFSYRSCQAFVRFSFVLFAFFVRLRLVRIVNLYDPGSVLVVRRTESALALFFFKFRLLWKSDAITTCFCACTFNLCKSKAQKIKVEA
jgi:hypothetical protein